MEEIKDIKGFEGKYKISSEGIVFSFLGLKERILKPRYDKRGYVQYILYFNGQKKSIKAHHLVFEHFGEGKRNGRIVNIDHIDGNKNNNCIDNLQLLTNRENLSKGKLLKENKSSKYTGVYRPKNSNKFQVYITINKKHHYLGSYENELVAAEVYNNKVKELNELR